MTTQQPEALRAEFFPMLNAFGEAQWQSGRGVPRHDIQELGEAVFAMVERQHARITELEAQLEAIGAGGVTGPLIGQPSPPEGMAGWVRVDERLPESGTPVLLDIGKKYPIRAMLAAKHMVEASLECADDWGDYDEATSTYYCPEGWYEWNEHEETHWAVSETPRSWMPLPASEASA